jgi:hypothetical protein
MEFIVQAYHTSQYAMPRGGNFLGKRRSSFAGSSNDKMNVPSACALNTRYIPDKVKVIHLLKALRHEVGAATGFNTPHINICNR